MVRSFHLVGGLLLGACFSGRFLEGQPCSTDKDCGTELSCKDGFCGAAPVAQSSSTGVPTTTIPDPTTGVTSTTSVTASTTSVTASTSDATSTTSTSTTSEVITTGSADSSTGETCGIGHCKDIDLLFVYDDSPSMGKKIQTIEAAELSPQGRAALRHVSGHHRSEGPDHPDPGRGHAHRAA